MTPAIMARFARMAKPDLSLMNDEGFTASRLRIEILSGLTVALALVPEAVAFAFVAQVQWGCCKFLQVLCNGVNLSVWFHIR